MITVTCHDFRTPGVKVAAKLEDKMIIIDLSHTIVGATSTLNLRLSNEIWERMFDAVQTVALARMAEQLESMKEPA